MSDVIIGYYYAYPVGVDQFLAPLAGSPIQQEVIASVGTSATQTTIVASAANLAGRKQNNIVWRVTVIGSDAVVFNFGQNPNPANAAAAKLAGPVVLGNTTEWFALGAVGDKVAVILA